MVRQTFEIGKLFILTLLNVFVKFFHDRLALLRPLAGLMDSPSVHTNGLYREVDKAGHSAIARH